MKLRGGYILFIFLFVNFVKSFVNAMVKINCLVLLLNRPIDHKGMKEMQGTRGGYYLMIPFLVNVTNSHVNIVVKF